MAYKFHSDAGHGWLAVKVAELYRLGIEYKISQFSYIKGKTAYLEEDCDLSLFLRTKKERGETVEIVEGKPQKYSPVRSYNCYTAGRASIVLAHNHTKVAA